MKKSFKIVYCALFFLLLCLPMALMPFFKNDAGLEKRALAEFPAYLSEGRLNLQYSDQFESWMSDHIPLRANLLTASNTLKGELLRAETSNVIVGRDGWLFFASEAPDYLGTNALTDDQIRSMAVTLSLLQERVEANGGRFTFAPVPNKSSVYSEYMPERFRRAAGSNLTRLQALLPEFGVNHTDLLGLLSAAKEQGVYHRRDSHWNYRGALLGANAILDSLGRAHDAHDGAPWTAETTWRGDLDKLLLPAGGVMDEQIVYDVQHAAFRFTNPQGVSDQQAQLEIFMSDRELRDNSFAAKNQELEDGSALYMARDSFGRALLPWMIDAYETADFRRVNVPDVDALEPGTDVVFEIAERNLDRIIAKAPFMYAPERKENPSGGGVTEVDLEYKLESNGYAHLYGVLPEDADLRGGRVYLLLERDGAARCFEAFPIYESSLLGEADRNGFSAYFPEDSGLSGTYDLCVIVGGVRCHYGTVVF